MSREKVSAKEKIEAARACIDGRMSRREAARRLGVNKSRVQEWVCRYRAQGEEGFQKREHNRVYSVETKEAAVRECLSGRSIPVVSAEYGLTEAMLCSWIKVYNSGRDFSHKTSGGSRMKQGRETTQEERITIAKDCLENGSNYSETAIKYNVSYQQVYTWVKKFRELGEAGLEDRRGRKTAAQEPRT